MKVETAERPAKRHVTLKGTLGGLFALAGVIAAIVALIDFAENRSAYNLSGEWRLVNTIESTTFRPYRGIRLGYRLFLRQRGIEIEGTGEKWSENDVELASTEHTPIMVKGLVEGDQISATFVEEGKRRRTTGTFTWRIVADGRGISGTFTSTAADSRGPSTGERVR